MSEILKPPRRGLSLRSNPSPSLATLIALVTAAACSSQGRPVDESGTKPPRTPTPAASPSPSATAAATPTPSPSATQGPGGGDDGLADPDGDGLVNVLDPCPGKAPAAGQPADADADSDGIGDGCDSERELYNPGAAQRDDDGDGISNLRDKCRFPDADQADPDADGHTGPCDCGPNNPAVHPGAPDTRGDGLDSDCANGGDVLRDANGVPLRDELAQVIHPAGDETEFECLPGDRRVEVIRPDGTREYIPISPREDGSTVVRVEGVCRTAVQRCLWDQDGSTYATTPEAVGPSPLGETCNDLDDDCDGVIDEDCGACNVGEQQPCGVGACAGGTRTCDANGNFGDCVSSRQPGEVAELCNDVDDDCDGQTDENFRVGSECEGRGVCGADGAKGAIECVSTTATACSINNPDNRASGLYVGVDELCNGVDDDCDGRTDEEKFSVGGDARVEVTGGVDSQGRAAKGSDCRLPFAASPCSAWGELRCSASGLNLVCSSEEARNQVPHLFETGACNDLDDDCDGQIDEGCGTCNAGETQPCGVGACAGGTQTCNANGNFGDCVGGGTASEETCNGVDDDCDGVIDDFVQGEPGDTCSSGVGACASRPGRFECSANGVLVCSTERGGSAFRDPGEDVCNRVDDDCNGETDEDFYHLVGDAQLNAEDRQGARARANALCILPGACAVLEGRTQCSDGNNVVCSTVSLASAERCEGLVDENCNGVIDDGCECVDESTRACGVATGECRQGTNVCVEDEWSSECAGDLGPAPERCNGLDDDCDGAIDETFQQLLGDDLGALCSGRGVCSARPQGNLICDASGSDVMCSANVQPPNTTERCNNLDDDCDGVTDEGFETTDGLAWGDHCRLPGVCGRGVVVCTDDGEIQCSSESQKDAERCNAVDDDCDGVIDENFHLNEACSVTCADGTVKFGTVACEDRQLASTCTARCN